LGIVLGTNLRDAVIDIRYDEVAGLVRSTIDAGSDPLEVLGELREGLQVVGERYQEGEYFLSQLYLAATFSPSYTSPLRP
jgi:5-methyltetrahydrofolate--homocysteine methyltransferase